jgi:NAD(P)H-hydrate epimerase
MPAMNAHPSGLYSAAQAREFDRLATARFDIPSFELMTRAGRAAARVIRERLPLAQRVVVACGLGNNAGDGYVLARLLKESGREVRVYALDGRLPVTEDAERAAKQWLEAGGKVDLLSSNLPECDVLVDALFGIGLSRDLSGSAAAAVRTINQTAAVRVALDIASGLCADTGGVRGSVVQADLSIAFIVAKLGQYTGEGPACSGERLLESLNLPTALLQSQAPLVEVMQRSELAAAFKPRSRTAHKGHFGHVLVIGGDSGMGGAVRLAAEAALRCGAGRVSVATRAEHVAPLLAARPELMVRGVAGPAELKPLLDRATVVLAGPGLGQSAWSETLLLSAAQRNLPSVFDADALNLLAQGACLLPEHLVLTPHPGEAAALLECSSAEVQADRLAALGRLVQAFQVSVVLKGAGTLVSGPRGQVALCPFGNPGMATAGSGDVLAGLIAGLLAQGWTPAESARLGVLLHAVAGDQAARSGGGERGMLAGDLLAALRGLLNADAPRA